MNKTVPTNTQYDMIQFKRMFKMMFDDEQYNKHEFMRFSDIKQSLPKQFKKEQVISPFNYYANKIDEPPQKTDEVEIAQIEKKETMEPSDVEKLTQLYGIKEHETYNVEKYKQLMQNWKNLTERLSELTLNNYGIFRPTPQQSKRTDYKIDFSPLFYKLTGKITEERNQRILKNIELNLVYPKTNFQNWQI